MRRISLVLLIGLAAASVGGAGPASPSTADRSVAAFTAADCTPAEKAQRLRALATYQRTMMAQRRAFFRSHTNPRAGSAFVRRQQAKLRALRQAAACTVIPLGARIIAAIPIPNEGGVGVGAGRVWVSDRASGLLRKVDPATNSVADEIPGVRGAAPVVGEGAVWVASALINRLLRVDLESQAVTQIETGPTTDEWPISVVLASGSVWVGNHHGGTVVRIDPRTNAILGTVRWGDHANGGIFHMTTDGASIWIAGSRTSDVAELDTRTNSIVRRTPVPTGTCGGVSVDASAVWITSGFDRPYACWNRANWGVSRIDRATGSVTRIDVGGRPIDVRDAFGSVWVVIDAPRLELVRLDPTTFRVIGRLPLLTQRCVPQNTGSCPGAEYGSALAVGFDSLWVRVSSLGLVPGLPAPSGTPQALLRIEPNP